MLRVSRPLAIADIMILVFATAVGLALGEFWLRELIAELPQFTALPPQTGSRTIVSGRSIAILLAATLAFGALRFRQPRSRLRLLLRQPGSVACMATASALLIQIACARLDLRTMGGYTSPLLVAAWYWPSSTGSAVLASWLVLLGGRGWHPGDWVDRFGMVIGFGWVGLPLLLSFVEFG